VLFIVGTLFGAQLDPPSPETITVVEEVIVIEEVIVYQTLALPEKLNYTATEPISNYVVESLYAVNGGYPLTVQPHDGMVIILGNYYCLRPLRIWNGLDTIPIEEHANWTGQAVTKVVVVYYENLTSTDMLSEMMVETGMPYKMTLTDNRLFSSTIVGNCIEFSYSEHSLTDYVYLTLSADLPEGVYTIIQYYKR